MIDRDEVILPDEAHAQANSWYVLETISMSHYHENVPSDVIPFSRNRSR